MCEDMRLPGLAGGRVKPRRAWDWVGSYSHERQLSRRARVAFSHQKQALLLASVDRVVLAIGCWQSLGKARG